MLFSLLKYHILGSLLHSLLLHHIPRYEAEEDEGRMLLLPLLHHLLLLLPLLHHLPPSHCQLFLSMKSIASNWRQRNWKKNFFPFKSFDWRQCKQLYFQPLHISHCVQFKKHLHMKMWQKHLYCQELLSDAGILLYANTFNVYIFIRNSYNFHPKFCKSILSFTYLYHMSKDLNHMSKDLYVQINVANFTQRE